MCPATHLSAAGRPCVGAAQAPLADLASEADARLPGCGGLARELRAARRAWAAAGGEASLGGADLRCVLPLADGRSWPWQVIPRQCHELGGHAVVQVLLRRTNVVNAGEDRTTSGEMLPIRM